MLHSKYKDKLPKAFKKSVETGKVRSGVTADAEMCMFPVTQRHIVTTVSNVYLLGGVDDASDFIAATEVLNSSEEGDAVIINLQSPGGCISSGDMLLHAIMTAQERGVLVHCVATGLCASLATWILLACESFELGAGFHALIHSGSMSAGGTFGEFKAFGRFYTEYVEKRIREIYEGFLSEEEITEVMEGKDLWLTPQEWVDRFKIREQYFEALSAQEAEEALF